MHTVKTNNLTLTLAVGGTGVHLKYKDHAKFFIGLSKYTGKESEVDFFLDTYQHIVTLFIHKLKNWEEKKLLQQKTTQKSLKLLLDS